MVCHTEGKKADGPPKAATSNGAYGRKAFIPASVVTHVEPISETSGPEPYNANLTISADV